MLQIPIVLDEAHLPFTITCPVSSSTHNTCEACFFSTYSFCIRRFARRFCILQGIQTLPPSLVHILHQESCLRRKSIHEERVTYIPPRLLYYIRARYVHLSTCSSRCRGCRLAYRAATAWPKYLERILPALTDGLSNCP